MTSFDARLRVVGQSGFPLGVVVDLSGDRMIVTAGTDELADWAVSDIQVHSLPDGFHIRAEGEEVVINVSDGSLFASEIRRRTPAG
ncbi:MAG: hypothetical protein WD269_11590 [Acidimicrobiia bacterium]